MLAFGSVLLPPVVVGCSVLQLTRRFAELCGEGINHFEQRFGEAKIIERGSWYIKDTLPIWQCFSLGPALASCVACRLVLFVILPPRLFSYFPLPFLCCLVFLLFI